MPNPTFHYERTAAEATKKARTQQALYDRLALVRLVIFVGWLAALIVLITTTFLPGLVFFVATVPLIAYGVRRHLAIRRAATEAAVLAGLAEGELAALAHDFSCFDGGADLLDPQHSYALDLDIFGKKSLFQFLNRTVTAPGRVRLAAALSGHHKQEEAARTREQSKDLSKEPDWCLRHRTIGHDLEDTITDAERLLAWLDRPPVAPTDASRILLFVAPLLTLASLAWMLLLTPWQLGVLGLLPAIWMLRKYRPTTATEHTHTAAMGDLLKTYAALLAHAETRPGADALPGKPQRALGRLASIVAQLDVRYNPFSILLEVGGLWSLNQLRKLDAWRDAHRADLPIWLAELAETDALVSWATLRFNHQEWTDPEFTDEPVVEAAGLGHPLLPPAGRITNDFRIGTDGHIHLVTGSNMAGKSTWLRTVGLNLVLASAGGPVCATPASSNQSAHLRTRPNLQVWTSMRTQDDLSESTSSFYAELKRLKAIIEAVSDPNQEVFFLLDEILKGTNSRDRHTGSRALIRQLIRDKGAGIIATHDLELGLLEAEPGSRVENFAMEVQVAGDALVFDYKLHPGVCQSFNATALMARMGIDIPKEEIRLRHE
jgi:hypothetical protein